MLFSVYQVKSDCYYDTNGGGCVLLSYPDTNGNCLNYYTTIFDQISPNSGICYDGYYSTCLCATYASSTSCVSFADFSTTSMCSSDWQTVGSKMITDNIDTTCYDSTVTFVPGPNTNSPPCLISQTCCSTISCNNSC